MNKAIQQYSKKLYSLLVYLYPKQYRDEFGEEMKFVFSELLKDTADENGVHGIINLWFRTVLDAGITLITEHIRNQKKHIMKTKNTDIIMQNNIFSWIAGGTLLLLFIPFLNMQMGGSVNWSIFDFLVMGVLLFGMASLFVIAARIARSTRNRIIIAAIVGTAFLYLWAELAVGVFTNWGS